MKRTREEGEPHMTLYGYWRSSCSWRVRLALELKQIAYEYKAVNLLKNEEESQEYLAINPAGLLPTLIDGKVRLSESLAILEYLEEKFPGRGGASLLPRSFEDRAAVRSLCLHIASGVQPLQNLGVLQKVEKLGGAAARAQWGKDVITDGMEKLEKMLLATSGKYCVGDEITMADLFLVPQVYNAGRFGVSMEAMPTISRIMKELEPLEAFRNAHPDAMPDAVKA